MKPYTPKKEREAIRAKILHALKSGEKYEWIQAEYQVCHMTIQRVRREAGLVRYFFSRTIKNK